MSDNVNHPSHYTQGGIECIKAIEASMTPEGFQDYCKGNVLKYIWRWRDKAGVEDLKKASVYLNWLVKSAEKDQPKNDVSSLNDCVRYHYFYSLVEDLRICHLGKGCSGCRRSINDGSCDLLDSDAADAIEFLIKELKEKEDSKEEKKEVN